MKSMTRLPLFVVEREDWEKGWVPTDLRRCLYRDLVSKLIRDSSRPQLRAKRVKTLEEANTLVDTLGCGLWFHGLTDKIIWACSISEKYPTLGRVGRLAHFAKRREQFMQIRPILILHEMVGILPR